MYSHFLNTVAGLLDIQSSFCEGCSCHEHEGLKHNAHKARVREIQTRLHSAVSDANTELPYPATCPLKGRRAAELASGAFQQFVEDAMELTKKKLGEFQGRLSCEDWRIIVGDWVAASETWRTTQALRPVISHWYIVYSYI